MLAASCHSQCSCFYQSNHHSASAICQCGNNTLWGCTTLVLCAADVFSLEPASFPLHTLSAVWNCSRAWAESRSAAVRWEHQRYRSSKKHLISLVLYYGSFVIFAWVWMRPHKTLNHFVKLNHYMATFQLLSLVISFILSVCVCSGDCPLYKLFQSHIHYTV